jgi:hypothetical protein
MTVIDRMELQLRSARDALERIHVLGAESGLMDGAIRAITNVIETINIIKKEEAEYADQGRRNGVQSQMDLSDESRNAADDGAGN